MEKMEALLKRVSTFRILVWLHAAEGASLSLRTLLPLSED